ncbi:basic-leucine zipper transcription factor A-like [Rhopalosiphum maidis]|uniref:basic-leucine zipper transcription factor A-like n=1 Tax=Rhopalosiphum maidis TaxID=43146 RepID=UPI000EFF4FE2|nr:basic-leucine zipper transcription factor A-like [Rhopalosiphum maidis]
MIMAKLNGMVIFCLVQLTLSEDRISVDTVGTITATAGYSIADNHSPTIKSLTSSIEFSGDHDSSKESSSSSESYSSLTPSLRSSQSLSLRSRQARGKSPSQSWSAEEKDLGNPSFSLTDHRLNEQLYSVKPQTFENQSPQLSDVKSNESVEKSSITYGKKMHKNDGHDDRPVFNDWSEEVHMAFDNKSIRSRRKNKHQLDSEQEKRKTQNKKLTENGSNIKDGWQELSPNMEIATGIITSVQEHDTSQESSGSSELFKAHHHPDLFHEDGVSSAEDAVHQTEPQNFDHKQVLSKMNHFDFSNAVPQGNKTPPPREKRLNYLQPGGGGPPPVARYPFSGAGPLQQPSQQMQVVGPSSQPHPAAVNAATAKAVKIEQPSATPNYHSIVVPIPISHQMYASIGGDPTSPVHGHQLASSTVQQAMMSLPVVHNVFFKTDENGGGKIMPAIVIPLKPEYLHQLQQQHYAHAQQQHSAGDDSLNAAGHQRPVHQGAGKALQFQQLHHQQLQQQQQQQQSSASPTPYAQKPKTGKVKKPFGLQMKDNDLQHRVKQPFSLQHQFYNNPFAAGGGAVGHVQLHHAGHQQQHGGGQQHPQHDAPDDSRYAQTAAAPDSVPIHAFPGAGHPIVVKRPHAYGYASPTSPTATKYSQTVNKSPQLHHHNHNNHHHHPHNNNLHHHHQQQQPSTEELATAIAQQQLLQQPYKATTYHPGYAYLNGPDDDYPYKPIYKDMNKRNDVLVVRTSDGRN